MSDKSDKIMQIIMQLMMSVTPLIGVAELAFSSKPGSGEAKKQMVVESIKAGMATLAIIQPKALNKAQSAAILKNVDDLIDTGVELMNTVKLFDKSAETPPPAVP